MGEKAPNYIRIQYLLRFVLTGGILILAALAPDYIINLWGAAAGIFTLQIAVVLTKNDIKDMDNQAAQDVEDDTDKEEVSEN